MADRNVIHEAVLQIRAETAQLRTDLAQGRSMFEGTLRQMQGLARTLMPALSIVGIGALIRSVVDLGDKLSDLSDQTGLTIETLGGVKVVADQNNSSIDAFATGILRAQRNLGDITGTGKEAAAALKVIGLNAQELINVPTDEFLERLATALATVENRNERAAIATKVLGRAGAELLPTILALAENGIPKLDKSVADAYRTLGQFKDQIVVLTAKLYELIAVPIAGWIGILQRMGIVGLSKLDEFGKQAQDMATITETVARSLGKSIGEIEGASSQKLQSLAENAGGAAKIAVEGLIEARKKFDTNFKNFSEKPGSTPAKGLLPGAASRTGDDSGMKRLQSALDSYRDSLQKVIQQQEIEKIKLTEGDQAAMMAAQAYDALALKAKLAADKLPIPPEVEASARQAEATLRSLGVNLDLINEKDFEKLREAALSGFQSVEQLKQSLEQGPTIIWDDEAAAGIETLGAVTVEAQRRFVELGARIQDMQRNITDVFLTEEEKRKASVEREYQDAIKQIEEYRQAAIAAHEDVTDQVKMMEDLAAQAREKKLTDAKQETDELTKFQERAFERAFDAVADGLSDLLDGNFKNFGQRVRKIFDQLAADILTLQLKALVLGPEFGKSGGKVGGLVGQLEEWLGGIFGGGAAKVPDLNAPGTVFEKGGAFARPPFLQGTAPLGAGGTLDSAGISLQSAAQQLMAAASALQGGGGVLATSGANAQLTEAVDPLIGIFEETGEAVKDTGDWCSTLTRDIGGLDEGFRGLFNVVQGLMGMGGARPGGGVMSSIGQVLGIVSDVASLAGGFLGGGGAVDVSQPITVTQPGSGALLTPNPKFHEGGLVTPHLRPNEVGAVLEVGERVLTGDQQKEVNGALGILGMSLEKMHDGGLVANSITPLSEGVLGDFIPGALRGRNRAERPQRGPISVTLNLPKEQTDYRSLKRHEGQIGGMLRRAVDKATREV